MPENPRIEVPGAEAAIAEAMMRDEVDGSTPSGAYPILSIPISSDEDQSPNRLLYQDGQANIALKSRVIAEWARTQGTENSLRRFYAKWVLILVTFQVLIIAVVTFLLGFKVIDLDPWTIRTLLIAVFLELATIMGVVTRYLFEGRHAHLPELLRSMDNREHIRQSGSPTHSLRRK